MSVFKLIRVVFLLSILFVILVSTWMTERSMAAWERPILVTIFPIAADDDPDTLRFVEEVELEDFADVNQFMERESQPYGFRVTPAFRFQLAAPGRELPPPLPAQFEPAAVGWWSLKMRWWAWMKDLENDLVSPDIQMFVLYRSLNGNGESGISVGMRKGRYGIVRAYARKTTESTNLVVFTHELLHVLGATDKYILSNGEPIFPQGYAKPNQRPLFPQQHAEIMGGRIPINSYSSVMPDSLEQCRIGRQTAEEIGFFDQLGKF
ncbi:MAG: hypothetical protein HKN57_10645 [Xanthomonadales bacterium]|nr:hypothetical protein [Gammaproteobacteria bacterium]MBT8054488.1 hypothetical protein [Gammaproteobacteria bacterium]NND57703.1 hypothetical protein [Xanthomonadales bacterium]NNK52626.1 hypothetical protein [Xanthomonadales bacterium]